VNRGENHDGCGANVGQGIFAEKRILRATRVSPGRGKREGLTGSARRGLGNGGAVST